MWMFVLVGIALFVGLRARRAARADRAIILTAAVLAVSYVAVTKHLL